MRTISRRGEPCRTPPFRRGAALDPDGAPGAVAIAMADVRVRISGPKADRWDYALEFRCQPSSTGDV